MRREREIKEEELIHKQPLMAKKSSHREVYFIANFIINMIIISIQICLGFSSINAVETLN